LKKLMVIDNI